MARNVRVVTGGYAPQDRATALADALTVRALKSRTPAAGGPVQAAMSPWEGVAQLGEATIAALMSKKVNKLAEADHERMLNANDAMIRQLAGEKAPRRMNEQGQSVGGPVEMPTDLEGRPMMLSDKAEQLSAAMAGMDPKQGNQVLSGAMLQKALVDPAQEEAYTLTPGAARFKGGQQIASMPTAPERPTGEVAEYEFYAKQEAAAGRQPEPFGSWTRNNKRAGASSTSVNMPYDNKWAQATAENDAKRLDAMRTSADAGRGALRSVQRLRQLNPGAASGGTAEARMTAANILNGLGFSIDPKLAATQEFDAIASRMVIDSLGGSLGTGFSNADRDFVTRTVPQIGHSMEARTALLNFMEGKFNQQVNDYNQADAYARKNNGLAGYNPNPPVTKVYNPVTGQIEDAPQ